MRGAAGFERFLPLAAPEKADDLHRQLRSGRPMRSRRRGALARRARLHLQEEFSAEVAEDKLLSFYGEVDRQLNPRSASRRPVLAR